MNALRRPPEVGKLFVAAEYWEYGEVTQRVALFLGYGALYKNGEDLSVHVSDSGYHFRKAIECNLTD
jgi:hypothetical protein